MSKTENETPGASAHNKIKPGSKKPTLLNSVAHAKPIILVLLLASLLPALNGSALNVAIPTIGIELDLPAASLGWIVSGYSICCLTLALPIGRLADLTSRRSIFITGIFLLSIASGTTVFAYSLEAIIVCRLAQGIGAACLFATTFAIINQVFPTQRRGQMLGISVSATYVGLATGPVFGGLLTHYLNWRSVFIFLSIFGIVAGIVALICFPRRKPAAASAVVPARGGRAPESATAPLRRQMDPLGLLLFFVTTIAISIGLNLLPGNLFNWLLLAGGIFALVGFVLYERRATSPLIPMVLFSRGSSFLLSCLSALFNYSAMFAVSYLTSLYLQQVMGLSAGIAGIILIIAPLTQTIITPFSGRLSDHHSPFLLASIGMIICALGLLTLIILTFTGSLINIFVSLIVVGIGFGLFSPPNTNAIMSQAPREHSSVASSFASTMRNSGQMVSMAIITIVMAVMLGQTAIADTPPDSIASVMRICCIIFMVICVVGIFTSLRRRHK